MTVPCHKTYEKTVEIVNTRGLHARAAAKFVQTAERYRAGITVSKDDMSVGGRSIMGLLMLGASRGTCIRITAEGEGAEEALSDLTRLVEGGFGEEA
jgi:phosphocarrier protein HPr